MNWLKVFLDFIVGPTSTENGVVSGRPAFVPSNRKTINPDDLRARLQALVTEPEYQPHPSPENPKETETHCNFFVRAVAHWYGYKEFDGMMANGMHKHMQERPEQWKLVGGKNVEYDEAIAAACQGCLVVAAQTAAGHGHVVVLAPESPGERSDSWKKVVPFCANVGKTCWYGKRLSQAFIQEPEVYLYIGA